MSVPPVDMQHGSGVDIINIDVSKSDDDEETDDERETRPHE